MTRRLLLALAIACAGTLATMTQEIPLEYRVKAAFLYNFVKYVEWPEPRSSPIKICVAGQNPFGTVLEDVVRDERVRGTPLVTDTILEPLPGCDVIFMPRTSRVPAYLTAAAGMPILTVGETPDFIERGGIIRFYLDSGNNVRFEINRAAAERANLRISSRLLQLARLVDPVRGTR